MMLIQPTGDQKYRNKIKGEQEEVEIAELG